MKIISAELNHYRPAIHLARVLPRFASRVLSLALLTIGIVLLGTVWTAALLDHPWDTTVLMGLTTIDASCLALLMLLRFYHNAHYYRGFGSVIGSTDQSESGITYEVAEALLKDRDDVTKAFLLSSVGSETMLRAGVSEEELKAYLAEKRPLIVAEQISFPEGSVFSLRDLGMYLYGYDRSFLAFLDRLHVTEEVYRETLFWVTGKKYAQKQKERWWSKDNLSQHPGIGSEWAYGIPYLLNQFSSDLHLRSLPKGVQDGGAYIDEYVAKVEEVLARQDDANVLLVGEAGVGKMDILTTLAKRSAMGKSLGSLRQQHFLVLDADALLATKQHKHTFEPTFIELMNQAALAGNVVLIIDDIAGFIRHAASIDVDVVSLLDPYLGSPELHIVGISEPGVFHASVEAMPAFVRRFTTVLVESPDLEGTQRFIRTLVPYYEARYGTLMTYPAVVALVQGADRYIVTGVMPDRAVHLLDEVLNAARQDGVLVTDEFVERYISTKTGIPVGDVQDTEREKLLNLETELHARVVGQESAIEAISGTMRRARAGIQDSDKPIGTFLFLGPTGVGKTETAKALAHVFFGAEEHMVRFDMSEYGEGGSVARLIGVGEKPGVLTEKMREHPYAVVLLDEFEKAEQPVHDLFLQILDEGRFTNVRGERINMRNTIIIATSNAGSAHILDAIARGNVLSTVKEEIVHSIIRDGYYRPELINRFDNVVLFEPLSRTEQRTIAGYLLAALAKRVAERGYVLEINDTLLETVATLGYSEEYGARPMRRVVQDVVEEAIAKKIIAGQLHEGDSVVLTSEDLQ